MEAYGNFRRPAAFRKLGVPGASVWEVGGSRKNPFGPQPGYSVEVEVEDVPVRSIIKPFFKLLQITRKGNYRLNDTT